MPMTGFFCQDEYLAKTVKLTDEEVGRLFRALMNYHASGKVAELDGRESIAFDFIREDIDKAEVAYQKKCNQASENRRKGLKQNTTPVNARQRPLSSDNGSDHNNINKCNVIEKDNELSLLDDDEAHAIQDEQNRVLDAAEDAGFQRSNMIRARLIALYADNGLQKLLDGINECVRHGAPNLAYLEAVLKGQPKKEKARVVAQDYGQRDYKSIQDELLDEQNREMEEYLKRSNAG